MRALIRAVVAIASTATGVHAPAAPPRDPPSLEEAGEFYRTGRMSDAVAAYRLIAEAAESSDPTTAGTARNNACVILMNTGDLIDALEECEAAVRTRRLVGDPLQLARSCNNLGLALQYAGRYEESESSFEEALRINEERGDVAGQTINWANLGVVATQAGWYSKALRRQQRALQLARQFGDEPWAPTQIRLASINQAVVLERLGAFREALDLYDSLLDDQSLEERERAGLILNRGVVLRNLGDPVRAVEAYERAIAVYRALGDRAALSNAHLNLALVREANLGDAIGAEREFRECLALAQETGDLGERVRGSYHLGSLLLRIGRVEEAVALFESCLAASEASDSSEGRWAAREGLGRVSFQRGDFDAALAHALAAIDEIEQVRGTLSGSRHRIDYLGGKRGVYELAVDALARLDAGAPDAGHAAHALEIAHRAKARGLLDALGAPESISPHPASSDIAELFDDDLLLEFLVSGSRLHLWTVHGGRVALRTIDDADALMQRVEAVHGSLSHGEIPAAQTLDALSGPLLADLDGLRRAVGQVRVAPDGALFYLPFEILRLPNDGRMLVERHVVSYLPSGAALGWLRRQDRSAPHARSVIGLGDPPLVGEAGAEPGATELLIQRFRLGRLPAAIEELTRVTRWIPGSAEIRTGRDATEESLRTLAADGADVLHIVSHTILDERPGRGAALLLAPGPTQDGLLFPGEIAELKIPVELTVLAACRTALGKEGESGAMATLTGAFLAAGSSGVVATLWDVGDKATAAFMDQFYFGLSRGRTPAEAMREAKRTMISDPDWSDPGIWAAYVLIGDASALRIQRVSRSLVIGTLLSASFVCLLLLRRRYGATRN